jgi:hypothetical protein
MCVKMAGKCAALSSVSDSAILGMWHIERIPESRGIVASCGAVPFVLFCNRASGAAGNCCGCIRNKAPANNHHNFFLHHFAFTILFIKRVMTTTLELA